MATNAINQQPVGVITSVITNSDTGTFEIGNLPPKAVIIDIKVAVKTAFDSATSDSLALGYGAFDGTSADDDAFEAAVDLQATGNASLTILKLGEAISGVSNVPVTAKVTSAGGSLSAGEANIVITYVQK